MNFNLVGRSRWDGMPDALDSMVVCVSLLLCHLISNINHWSEFQTHNIEAPKMQLTINITSTRALPNPSSRPSPQELTAG
jgi:hypothetical protein